jgi:hypothetical protein
LKLLVVLSHELSDVQKKELEGDLKITEIILMPKKLKNFWSDVNPKGELPINEIKEITEWILKESRKNDYVLVQGDFGATYYLVDFCFKNERIPIYATTKRCVEEKKIEDRTIINRVFKHVNFRKYKRYEV